MKKYSINASFKMIGGFWPPTERANSFPGILSSRAGRVNLLSSPEYKVLAPDEVRGRFRHMAEGRQGVPPGITLCGFTDEGLYTLMYSYERKANGLQNAETGQEAAVSEHHRKCGLLPGLDWSRKLLTR